MTSNMNIQGEWKTLLVTTYDKCWEFLSLFIPTCTHIIIIIIIVIINYETMSTFEIWMTKRWGEGQMRD